jgi:hypothetical protein
MKMSGKIQVGDFVTWAADSNIYDSRTIFRVLEINEKTGRTKVQALFHLTTGALITGKQSIRYPNMFNLAKVEILGLMKARSMLDGLINEIVKNEIGEETSAEVQST